MPPHLHTKRYVRSSNEKRAESGDKLEKTSWASSKDLDTADRQRNTGQLETYVAECRWTWTSWGVAATDLLSTSHDDDDDDDGWYLVLRGWASDEDELWVIPAQCLLPNMYRPKTPSPARLLNVTVACFFNFQSVKKKFWLCFFFIFNVFCAF